MWDCWPQANTFKCHLLLAAETNLTFVQVAVHFIPQKEMQLQFLQVHNPEMPKLGTRKLDPVYHNMRSLSYTRTSVNPTEQTSPNKNDNQYERLSFAWLHPSIKEYCNYLWLPGALSLQLQTHSKDILPSSLACTRKHSSYCTVATSNRTAWEILILPPLTLK